MGINFNDKANLIWAIADSRNDRRYAKAYNGLVEPMGRMASDDNVDLDTRARKKGDVWGYLAIPC